VKAGEARPANCRFRLHDEGKPYPRSSCTACGKSITTGLGKQCAALSPARALLAAALLALNAKDDTDADR